jgi:hypothetical protein
MSRASIADLGTSDLAPSVHTDTPASQYVGAGRAVEGHDNIADEDGAHNIHSDVKIAQRARANAGVDGIMFAINLLLHGGNAQNGEGRESKMLARIQSDRDHGFLVTTTWRASDAMGGREIAGVSLRAAKTLPDNYNNHVETTVSAANPWRHNYIWIPPEGTTTFATGATCGPQPTGVPSTSRAQFFKYFGATYKPR